MKLLMLTLALCFATQAELYTQATLTGQVTLQNSGNKSAFPAQVRSFGASDTDVNTEDGFFQLVYGIKKPGQEVDISVVKPDYEVVNRENLKWALPYDPFKQRRLKLFLCPKGRWREYADRFYKINYNSVVTRYQTELSKAQEQYRTGVMSGEAYKKQVEKLEKDRDYAIKEAERLSEIFAKANLDDASERFYKAYQYFSRGLIDSVLIVLDEDKMLEDLYRVDREIDDALFLIERGEQLVNDGETLKKAILHAKAWKDSLEREGLDQYCIRVQQDPETPVGPEYPAFEHGIFRIWLMPHRPNTVFLPKEDDFSLLRFVRHSYLGKTFSASMEAASWKLSQPTITLKGDTLLLFIRPDDSLATVKGAVSAANTGQAVAGVQVVCEGESAYTDEEGKFELQIPINRQKKVYQVHFLREGMPPTVVQTTPENQTLLKIVLH